jgi:putative ABC transport system permease protein
MRELPAALIRTFTRDRRYTVLNILGLAAGFAAAIFIFLFARNEFSYDRFLPEYQRTYLVTETDHPPGHPVISTPTIWVRLAAVLKLHFPQIEAIARLCPDHRTIRHGNVAADEKLYWADPNVFDLLRLKAWAGDLRGALQAPDTIVITRSLARKYFGRDAPIGETLLIDGSHPLRVTAVLADLPANTHLDLQAIASGRGSFSELELLDVDENKAHVYNIVYTYLRLVPGASATDLERGISTYFARRMAVKSSSLVPSLPLVRIDQVHLTPETEQSMRPAVDRTTIFTLCLIGVLIVGVASINFVNLMTARGGRRAIEIGVRKAAGALRRHLILQFMGESMLHAVLSMVMAIMVVELLLARFNAFLDRQIEFAYWRDPVLAAVLIATPLMVGVLAGTYPALVLSAFRPAAVLKGTVSIKPGLGRIRQLLVTLQFAVLISLAVASLVIHRQVEYALHEGLRVEQDQVLLISTPCHGAFPDRVRALTGVRAAACASSVSLNLIEEAHWQLRVLDGRELQIDGDSVDYDFFVLYGIRPLAGRFFSREHPGDAVSDEIVSALQHPDMKPDQSAPSIGRVVLNEAALRLAGFHTAQEAVGKVIYAGSKPMEIIGIVGDFSFDSVRKEIPPTFYVIYSGSFDVLNVKLRGRDIPETLDAIASLWRDSGQIKPMTWFFLDAHMRDLYLDMSRRAQIFAVFCALAMLISCLGLLGLTAFAAERRMKEIGVRKALGANTRDVLKLLLWQFSKPVVWANLIAWPVTAWIMIRWLRGFAYHVELPLWLFPTAAVAALLIALATVLIHALIAARARPVVALRYE